jgi:adenylate kinase
MRVILLGAPGSGKGTVAEAIRSVYGFPKISTGDLLREAVRERTPLGLKAETQMGKGGLVDDAIVLALLRERIAREDCRDGYTLDGFPRNIAQAESLEAIGAPGQEVVFDLQVGEDVILRRLTNRRTCPLCEAIYHLVNKPPKKAGICDVCGTALVQRADDKPEIIAKRLKTHHAQTEPLIARYAEKGTLHRIDGSRTPEATFADVKKVLDAVMDEAGPSRGRG